MKCVLCESNYFGFYGITHTNGNTICLTCVDMIKHAHFKVYDFPYEQEEKAHG